MTTEIDARPRKAAGSGFRLWVSWWLATTVGMAGALGLPMACAVSPFFYDFYGADTSWRIGSFVILAVPTIFGALLLGSSQNQVISRQIRTGNRWIRLTTVGWSAALLAVLALRIFGLADESLVLAGLALVPGVGLGACQWLVIRDSVRRAGWWILANLLGWSLGSLAMMFGYQLTGVGKYGPLVSWFSAALIPGGITGFALITLLRKARISTG